MTEYVVLDVFTDTPFCGNALAVFPDASSLSEDALQKIAREFNFSETTFVYPPADPENSASVRIFTPTAELPFAGHPTIGTAVALANRGRGPAMVLELGVGPIEAEASNGHASFVSRTPLTRHGEPDPEAVAACVGLDISDLETGVHPPVIASAGVPFVLAEVTGADALGRAAPVAVAFRSRAMQLPGSTAPVALYLYHRDGADVGARMFDPLAGIPEDPATGSAAAALALHLADLGGGSIELAVRQGVEMSRPSRIDVRSEAGAVTVSGDAVEVMRGELLAASDGDG